MHAFRIMLLVALSLVTWACGIDDRSAETSDVSTQIGADPVDPSLISDPVPAIAPDLPFADNPDPTACGIPVSWTSSEPAWVTGLHDDVLVQPIVYLYDTHLRREVIGQIPSGSRIVIELSQTNPVLNYYRVRSLDVSPVQEGWVPAPFVSFEPVE